MHYKLIKALKFRIKLNSIIFLEIKSEILHFENISFFRYLDIRINRIVTLKITIKC
jgi:hypothetical protein